MVYEEGEKAVEVHVAASLLVDHVDDRSDFARGEERPNVLESAADHLHARHAIFDAVVEPTSPRAAHDACWQCCR